MKILLFSNQGLAPLHLGIELEVIEQLLEEDHDVVIVRCDNQLEGCFFNPCHNLLGCAICQARSDHFYRKIGLDDSHLFRMQHYPESMRVELPFFESLDSLLAFEFDGVNIGRGVASSIISLRRDSDISSKTEPAFIEFQLRMAINVCLNFKNYISRFEADMLYFFNGRFAECFPLIGLAEKFNIPYRTMEVASTDQRYQLYHNSLPHSLATWEQYMVELWENASDHERETRARQWFESKREGTATTAIVFTGKQREGILPEGFSTDKTNIVIFNSSEDEMRVIEEWSHDLYESQNDAIERIVRHFSDHNGFQFYLRVHPNLNEVSNAQVRGIQHMHYANLSVIPADSDVDTYALMEASDKVLTFGSSTGVEATYWGKPSILFGRSFYQSLDCVYQPDSFAELCALLETPSLPAKPQNTVFPFGYYISANGRPYRFFEYRGKFNSSYRGHKMRRVYLRTYAYLLRYVRNVWRWIKYNRIVRGKSVFLSDITKLR